MRVFAGQGDSSWSMAALWRAAPAAQARPGPKPALELDAIITAATELADQHGLSGLSMKAVGERFGRTAMALYTYVPGKNELIDLMYDRVHAELAGAYGTGKGWREAVIAWADDLSALYLRHPWLLQVSYARPVLGPHEQLVVESVARILRDAGVAATTARRIVGVLIHLVRGLAQTMAESRHAATSEAKWWSDRAGRLSKVAPDFADRFPATIWLATGAPAEAGPSVSYVEREARATFTAGLAILLDGVEATIG